MKKSLLLIAITIISFTAVKAQCPPNATAFALNYSLCSPSPGCGVLLKGWPEGVIVSIIGGDPLHTISTVQIPGTYPGPGVADAFVCVPCDVPLIFASTVPGATNGCVIINTISVPVRLNRFSANLLENGSYNVTWSTASENGTEKFIVERSLDGVHFAEVTTVKAQATGSTEKEYSYTDKISGQYKVYYRLKTSDVTGRTTFSEIALVKNQSNSGMSVTSVNNTVKITVATQQLPAFVKIYNAQGNVVCTKKTTDASLTINEKLPAGIYVVKVIGRDNNFISQKFIIQ